MNSKALYRQLDAAETQQLERWDFWIKTVERSIPWREMERLNKASGSRQSKLERLPEFKVNVAGLGRVLANHGAEMVGAGLAHGDLLVADLHQTFGRRTFADLPIWDSEKIDPEEAISVMELRALVLAGDVGFQIEADVKKIMVNFLSGTSREDTETKLLELLQDTQERASTITTTESTYAYNRGRLISFRENEVDYVRFSAIRDGRTSEQCNSRHGKIMRLDDERLADNTPPLHGRCRSVLDPLFSEYQPEMLTEKSLDWSDAVALPKGWRAA